MIRNLTSGFTESLREHLVQRQLRGRAVDRLRSPGATPSRFFARADKRRTLFLVSALDGKVLPAHPRGPRPGPGPRRSCPGARRCIFAALQGRGLRHLRHGPRERRGQEPDERRVRRHRSPGLARRHDRGLHPARLRPRQGLLLPAGEPEPQDPAHLRAPRRSDARPSPPTASASTSRRTRTTTSRTSGASTSRPGSSSSTRTPWAATWRPPSSRARTRDRLAFITYYKAEYRLYAEGHRRRP